MSNDYTANIQLETKITQQDQSETFLYDVTGQVVKIGDKLYIRYEEPQTAEQSATAVTVKVNPDGMIQIIRAGDVRMRLRFRYEETLETNYNTPYGMMFFSTYTKDLRISLHDNPPRGMIVLNYDLIMQHEVIGQYCVKLQFQMNK